MNTRLAFAGLAALALLAGCSRQPGAGGLTADEERQLDNAAAMLDDSNNLVLSDDSMTANESDVAADEVDAAAPAAANTQ